MDNPRKLATQDEKKTKTKTQPNMKMWKIKQRHNPICVRHRYVETNTTQYVLDTAMWKQTQRT